MATISFEAQLEDFRLNVVDVSDFNERVVGAYNSGLAERGLPADDQTARNAPTTSAVPSATHSSQRRGLRACLDSLTTAP